MGVSKHAKRHKTASVWIAFGVFCFVLSASTWGSPCTSNTSEIRNQGHRAPSLQLERAEGNDEPLRSRTAISVDWPEQDAEYPFIYTIRHRYQVLDLDPPGRDASTNGHVHNLMFGMRWPAYHQAGRNKANREIAWSAGVASSSNGLINPSLLDRSAARFWFSWIEHIDWDTVDLSVGLCRDDRLGEKIFYPVVSLGMDLGSETLDPVFIRLGYPDSSLDWRIGESHAISLFWRASGGEWRVFDSEDSENEAASTLRWVAHTLALEWDWRLGNQLGLSFAVGSVHDQHLLYRLRDGEAYRLYPEQSRYASISLQWWFSESH